MKKSVKTAFIVLTALFIVAVASHLTPQIRMSAHLFTGTLFLAFNLGIWLFNLINDRK